MAQGRIKRLRSLTLVEEKRAIVSELSTCALCDREIPPALRDAHHLIPKSKGGVATVMMLSSIELLEYCPSYKCHAGYRYVNKHVVSNQFKVFKVESKCQTPETGQEYGGEIPNMRRCMS